MKNPFLVSDTLNLYNTCQVSIPNFATQKGHLNIKLHGVTSPVLNFGLVSDISTSYTPLVSEVSSMAILLILACWIASTSYLAQND